MGGSLICESLLYMAYTFVTERFTSFNTSLAAWLSHDADIFLATTEISSAQKCYGVCSSKNYSLRVRKGCTYQRTWGPECSPDHPAPTVAVKEINVARHQFLDLNIITQTTKHMLCIK